MEILLLFRCASLLPRIHHVYVCGATYCSRVLCLFYIPTTMAPMTGRSEVFLCTLTCTEQEILRQME